MNLKDKIAIVLIVLIVVIFGIVLKNYSAVGEFNFPEKVNGTVMDMRQLADRASKNSDWFFRQNIKDWVGTTIPIGSGYANTNSGMCMYEGYNTETDNERGREFQIVDVYDFDFGDNGITLEHYGIKSVNGKDEPYSTTRVSDYTGRIAKCLYQSYMTKSYNSNTNMDNWQYYLSDEKGNIKAVLYDAINSEDSKKRSNFPVSNKFIARTKSYKNLPYYYDDVSDIEYGEEVKEYKKIETAIENDKIKLQHDDSSGYTMIGPFNVKYGGKSIKQITITETNPKESGDSLYFSEKETSIEDVKRNINGKKNGWTNDFSKIPSGRNFWIAIPDNSKKVYDGSDIDVTFVQSNIPYYKTRLILIVRKDKSGQPSAIYASKREVYEGTATFKLPRVATLKVIKKGQNNSKQKE